MRATKNNLKYFGPKDCLYDDFGDQLIELAISEMGVLISVEFLKNIVYKIIPKW